MVAVAQSVERLVVVQEVAGSSPVGHPVAPIFDGTASISWMHDDRKSGLCAFFGSPPRAVMGTLGSMEKHSKNGETDSALTQRVRWVHSGPYQVSYQIEINAPAREVWELISNPHRHHEFDGSGTVKPRVVGPSKLEVGDEFTVDMTMFGVDYWITSEVTESIPERLLEWRHPAGHRWRWEMAPQAGGKTLVRETFDYGYRGSRGGKVYELLGFRRANGRGIRASLLRLAQVLESGAAA